MAKLVAAIKKVRGYLEYGINVLDIVISFLSKFDGVIKLDAEMQEQIDNLKEPV